VLEDFTLQQEQDALVSFPETNISANRGMAVEKPLPPKNDKLTWLGWCGSAPGDAFHDGVSEIRVHWSRL
jgi:hypothetical protein